MVLLMDFEKLSFEKLMNFEKSQAAFKMLKLYQNLIIKSKFKKKCLVQCSFAGEHS